MASLITGEKARMYAQAGVMRAGASRANYHSTQSFVAIAGVQYAGARAVAGQQVEDDTLTIIETEGETPNTCSFKVRGFQPTDGQDVVITLGSINNLEREFAGTILTDAHGYVGTPANGHDQVNVIDYSWQLTRDTISQRWTNVSATVIAQAIIGYAAARGFTSLLVQAGLPVVDEFTVTNQTLLSALGALADRIGATVKPTYRKDVRFGIAADPTQTAPTILTPASALLTFMTDFSVTRDLGQVITRQPVEGGGSNALTEISPGETILPVEDASWYNVLGGTVVSGPQRMDYAGVQLGAGGSLVGPGAAPSVAPTLAPVLGAGLGDGFYGYGYTAVTASGESLPSPRRTIATYAGAGIANPAAIGAFTAGADSVSDFPSGSITYSWGFTFVRLTDGAETALSPTGGGTGTYSGKYAAIALAGCTSPPAGYFRRWYRTVANGATYLRVPDVGHHVNNHPDVISGQEYGGSFFDDGADAGLGAAAPASNGTGAAQRVAVANIAPGGSPTSSRKVYRTEVQATAAAALTAQLKLLATIADNTTTTYADSTADGSLGANVPTTDTSLLTQPAGQVNAGSTVLLTANPAPFSTTGGWARVGNQVVRYAGVSGNSLTGIPAAGSGALLNTVVYSEHVDAVPALTGIPSSGAGSILYTIKQGDPVNLRVVVGDLAAQAVIAALMLPLIDDGIIEGTVIQDGRLSETEAVARGTAQLALRKALAEAVAYTTLDKNTHAGLDIGVNLPTAPTSTVGTYKIQSVTSTSYLPARWPTRTVQGSSTRFTLEMLLRLARGGT